MTALGQGLSEDMHTLCFLPLGALGHHVRRLPTPRPPRCEETQAAHLERDAQPGPPPPAPGPVLSF